MKKIAAILCVLYALAPASAYSIQESFQKAKAVLEEQIDYDHRTTVYCGYEYDHEKRICLPAGFHTPSHKKRASRVEWEHAVPAEHFGKSFVEWREGDPICRDARRGPHKGRRCAERANPVYRAMQNDLYNLWASEGALNAIRSNKPYAELPDENVAFGTCEAKTTSDAFEPPDRAKGKVARSSLYMDFTYEHYDLGNEQRQLFIAWSSQYPVDEWECTRTKRIEAVQGNENLFVKNLCIEAGLW